MTDASSNLGDKVSEAKDAIRNDPSASTVQDQAKKVADAAGQAGKSVADRASEARDWAGERAGVARDWALDQTDVIRDTVQTRPFIAVGVSAASAFAAGLVLGVLLTRR